MPKAAFIYITLTTFAAASAVVLASERAGRTGPQVPPAASAAYLEECGACHMAYPPALLPARSWEKLMGSLSAHFGENAELSPELSREIAEYLGAHSAERSPGKLPARIARAVPAGEVPLRISAIPFIAHEHAEVPARLVGGNPEVKSFANCNACHTRAAEGSFRERDIRIPGAGKWDD